jgi:hypothetical protein
MGWKSYELDRAAQKLVLNARNGKIPTREIQAMSESLWALSVEDQRVAIAVLTQLCDCLVWWTQRYKVREGRQ